MVKILLGLEKLVLYVMIHPALVVTQLFQAEIRRVELLT